MILCKISERCLKCRLCLPGHCMQVLTQSCRCSTWVEKATGLKSFFFFFYTWLFIDLRFSLFRHFFWCARRRYCTERETPSTHSQIQPLPHKVLTYVEYRAVSGVFQNSDPPPPFHPASVSSPRTKGWGGEYTLAGRWRGGGSIFWKTPDIGLASYSIIFLHWIGLLQYNLSTP